MRHKKWFGCDEPYTLAVQFIELVGQESVEHLRMPVLYHHGAQGDLIEEEFQFHVAHIPNRVF